MAGERRCHSVGVGLPRRSRSLDVGEQEGHGTRHRCKLLRHRHFQRIVLRDDGGFESAKVRPRVDAEFVGEQRPRALISAQGLTLPAGAVESEHQLTPTPFTQRRVGDSGLEVADDLSGATRREQRIGPIFDKRGMVLDPPRLLGYATLATGQLGGAAPEGQGLVEAGHRLAGVSRGDGGAPRCRGRLVSGGIDLGGAQGPACALRQHKAVAQGAAQRGDVGLQCLGGGARRVIAPEKFHERVGRLRRNRRAARAS